MLAAFVAAYLAAAPLDPAHQAVFDVISHNEDGSACTGAQRRKAAASADVRKLGRVEADDVVLAQVYDPCICGAQNCPFYAIRLAPGKPRVLAAGFSITVKTKPAAPLPTIVSLMHDSAAVAYETTFVYRNGTYEAIDSGRVRGDGARKPNGVPVRFAPGASSATLRGTSSVGWYDSYEFAADKGQKVVIDGVRSRAKVRLTLSGPKPADVRDVRAGVAFTLPAAGTYRLQVESDSDADVPYALTLAIR